MTTFSISLGQDLIFHGGDPGDQVVVHSHGNGNALGNKLVQEGNNTVTPETLSQFIAFITGIGPLERGHTYIGHALFDPDNGDQQAELIVTDTQSG